MTGNDMIPISISALSSKPIYAQIEEQIRIAVFSGTLRPETELPSIRVLAQNLRVSVITTKRAYDDLEKEGYLRTVPGKGTYAARPGIAEMTRERLFALRAALEPLVGEAIALGFRAEDIVNIVRELSAERGEEHQHE
ncbi:MAG TPA: GntR family transcriptional regulator [Rectinemataceae bacterium]|nr:GntR family transcriptional regulator [Rectinemataceae bacterium]